MPAAAPELWKTARLEWESNPELTFTQVAERLGVAIATVSVRAKRELWVRSDIVDVQRINYTPQQMVEVAIAALVRASNQTYDIPSSVKAAGMLLDRALGRVVATAEPMSAPAGPEGAGQWPDWMDKERLGYSQEALPSESVQLPIEDQNSPSVEGLGLSP